MKATSATDKGITPPVSIAPLACVNWVAACATAQELRMRDVGWMLDNTLSWKKVTLFFFVTTVTCT